MRSAAEIRFRLRQEAANLALRCAAPGLRKDAPPGALACLPDPNEVASRLRGTAYRDRVRALAERILTHRFPVLGFEIETGPRIRWRRDALSGVETSPLYFRRIPYLDPARAGDHKVIWELNRHQHLVLLAQEFRFSGERRFLDEIAAQLESWWLDNPFQRGMNWTSALEVAFRALSWTWVWHLVSPDLPRGFLRRFATELYRHGLHVEYNLSIYFSPNTHLLGEAVCLHALGRCFPAFPRARRWVKTGGGIVDEQMRGQVREDGGHVEQSSYYHVYATDMFLFHAAIAETSGEYRARLERMAEHLEALVGPSGLLPMIGDDDGGRFFHPYSDRRDYALETLGACGRARDPRHRHAVADWWGTPIAPRATARPRNGSAASGLIVFTAGANQILFDAGPFGPGSGGHSHADALSVLARRGDEEILIDPGTYTYVGDPLWRNRFRGTAMHNTIRIGGLDQAEPGTPFSWRTKPDVRILELNSTMAAAQCAYRGFLHRRRVVFDKPGSLAITDEIEGPPGAYLLEQFWHCGRPVLLTSPSSARIGESVVLTIKPTDAMTVSEGGEFGWRSPALGVKTPAPVIVVARISTLPASFATELKMGPS